MGDDGGVLAKAKCCGGLGGATKRSCRVAGLVTGKVLENDDDGNSGRAAAGRTGGKQVGEGARRREKKKQEIDELTRHHERATEGSHNGQGKLTPNTVGRSRI